MTKSFELFAEFEKFGADQKIDLSDPAAIRAFVTHAREVVKDALDDPALIYGQRAEAMFEALLISLGQFTLLKPEDTGRIYPPNEFRIPDFRVVLNDGTQWLIEVKNVYEKDPGKQERKLMTPEYYQQLRRYSRAMGAELKLAVYWARWGVWTLVSPTKLVDECGSLSLTMFDAMKANEMGKLGDRTLGTKPPLRFRLVADPSKPRSLEPDGNANFTPSNVQFFCDDIEITDARDREIAWVFVQYGNWEESGPTAILDDDTLEAIEFCWRPIEQSHDGFAIIGSLSRMFARYFAEQTVRDGDVIRVRAPQKPDWFAPLVSTEYQSEQLPLWRFILQPGYGTD